jgi:TRAP-type C4-dicarboxylate transport system permease small subunit
MVFALVFIAINAQVFMRYVLHQPVQWSEELPTIAFSLSVLWAGALMLRAADHIVFDSVFVLLPERIARLSYGVGCLAAAAILFYIIPGVADFAAYMKVLSTPILRIRFDLIFFVFCFFIFASGVWHLYWGLSAFWRPLQPVEPNSL